jgi:hypothetical protein
MADFRKILVLAGLVLMLALTASAQSQPGPFTCVANAAVPPTVRAEGLTELVGDIVLDCTGGVPTAGPNGSVAALSIPQVNFTIFLNTNVTSRIINTTSNLSEAILMVDEPTTNQSGATQFLLCGNANGCSILGTGLIGPGNVITAGPEPYSGQTGRPNVFQGIVSGNQVQFLGVPVDAPGTTGHRVFRFTNIRANASGISAGASGTPGSIQALISASGSTSVPITSPTQVVGFVQPGMTFTLRNRGDAAVSNTTTNISFAQCTSLSRTGTASSFILRYTEGFASAFKTIGSATQSSPGQIYNTESGFTSGTALGSIGIADSGTRLKAVFTNLPTGVSVYASLTNYAASGTQISSGALLRSGEFGPVISTPATNTDFVTPGFFTGSVAGGGYGAPAASSGAQLPVVNGTATAVWEVVGANALSADNYDFAVWFSYSANAAQNSPAAGTSTVSGSFAPTPTGIGVSSSTAAAASATLPVPRFVDSTASRAALTIYLCRTNLLFPFVTNQSGFDTGLAIANTSLDTGVFTTATPTQTGGCTLFSYGDNAPASIPTGTVAAGRVYVNLASAVMPNFQGYVIAQCAFQFAHGFAFVSDLGARNLAMGYLALVIPEPGSGTRTANPPGAQTVSGSGEGLGQ